MTATELLRVAPKWKLRTISRCCASAFFYTSCCLLTVWINYSKPELIRKSLALDSRIHFPYCSKSDGTPIGGKFAKPSVFILVTPLSFLK